MEQVLYYNGTIITMENREAPYAEAVLTENGRIKDRGSFSRLREAAGRDARLADLQGAAMIPGFIDPHSHFTACAGKFMEADLSEARSFSDIVRIVREFIRESGAAPGQWVTASDYDHNRLEEGNHPGRRVLDEAAPENPLVVKHQSGHMGSFNTQALGLLGVEADTPSPEGGRIEKEGGSGEPTGYMEENAFVAYLKKVPMPSVSAYLEAYGRAQALYASHGITTAQEGMMPIDLAPLYKALIASGILKLDIVGYGDIAQGDAIREAFPGHVGEYRQHFKLGGYKIFLDGSPQGRTAWMRRPYEPIKGQPADYCGYGTMTDQAVMDAIYKSLNDGMQLLAHCNGDGACEQYLSCWERAGADQSVSAGGFPGPEASAGAGILPRAGSARPVMVHAQLLGLDQLPRLKPLGMIPSFFAAHVYHWGEDHVRNFGWERASRISPAGSALALGIPFTLHQDSPVIRPDMIETLWCAANRRTRTGRVLGEAERIPVWDALRAVTANGAWQYFEEGEKGTISPGKQADFAILSGDPLKTDPEALRDIQVLAAVKAGEVIWAMPDA